LGDASEFVPVRTLANGVLPKRSSTLAWSQNLGAYENPDVADLAAAYAVGIARNHAFLDGNKRTAWVVTETFLLKNGFELIASDRDGVVTMLAVADGTMSEPELAIWLRTYIRPLVISA
jgi:death-on-curing protein